MRARVLLVVAWLVCSALSIWGASAVYGYLLHNTSMFWFIPKMSEANQFVFLLATTLLLCIVLISAWYSAFCAIGRRYGALPGESGIFTNLMTWYVAVANKSLLLAGLTMITAGSFLAYLWCMVRMALKESFLPNWMAELASIVFGIIALYWAAYPLVRWHHKQNIEEQEQ